MAWPQELRERPLGEGHGARPFGPSSNRRRRGVGRDLGAFDRARRSCLKVAARVRTRGSPRLILELSDDQHEWNRQWLSHREEPSRHQ